MSLFTEAMIVYAGNPKQSTKNFQNKWVLQGCKIQGQYNVYLRKTITIH